MLDDLWRWVVDTPISKMMRESVWAYPAVEIMHIFGLAVLVGAAVLFDLRLLGLSRHIPVTHAARHLLRTAWVGLGIVVLSGALLFTADPAGMASNQAFQVKMLLIVVAGCNTFLFRLGPFRSVERWNQDAPAPRAARLIAIASLILWLCVIACGRLIAYT